MTKHWSPAHIVHVTDTGSEKLYVESAWLGALGDHWRAVRSEIASRIYRCFAGHPRFYADHHLSFAAANTTLDIGTTVSKLVNNPTRTSRLIIAANAAPNDNMKGTKDNKRDNFYCALLDDGTVVCGTTGGYEYAYVRDRITAMYELTASNEKKTQFRSRDTLPHYTALFADPVTRKKLLRAKNPDGTLKLKPVKVDDVVPYPPEESHVYDVDNSGNVKLYLSALDKALIRRAQATGQKVRVEFAVSSLELFKPKTPEEQRPFYEAFDVYVRPSFFDAKDRETILTTRSSTKRSNGDEVEQIAQVRTNHATSPPDFPLPVVGAAARLSLA